MPPETSATATAAPQQSAPAEATAPQAAAYRWVVLAVAVTALTTGSVVYSGVSVLIPLWKQAYHLSPATAALAASAIQAGPIASMLVLGWAIDRYGERWVVSLTMIAMGCTAFTVAAIGPNYPVLLLFIVLMGAFYGAILPGGQRAITRWFAPEQQGMATGIRQSGLPIGASIAAAVLPALALRSDWTAAVALQGGVAVVGGVVFGALYREGGNAAGARKAPVRIHRLAVGLVRDRVVRSLLIGGLALAALQYTFSAQILIFLNDQLKIPIVTAGYLFAVAQGAGILGRIGLAWISDHFWPGRRMRSLQWMLLVSAVPLAGLTLLTPGSPRWIVLALCTVLGLLSVGWYPLYLVQVADVAPQAAVASTISFAITLNQIIAAAMPPLFGLLVGWSGYPVSWSLLVAVLILTALQLGRTRAAATPATAH
ncbi:MFS transporter [Kitasatospora mediocidica]|uniref:MFS transporter n=1 Tax=Kitasatospora mediocidica TaxID=58352 RepID=UPI00056463FF|nr:MFS transporter [Kitasatospora mediocidica]